MDQVAQVRERIDIVSLIQEYIPLRKLGRNFKTNCPFHGEKTPSFVVSPERQIWHCFGCQKGGDCFTFLMEYENMEFPESLRFLAKKAGVELKEFRYDATSSKKENIYGVNRLASDFYHYILTEHNAGKRALDYLMNKRGLSLPLIKTFHIGFSPSIGSGLSKYLVQKKKYKDEELIEAGLSYHRNSLSDFFVGRIMFPLSDHRGNIVGFSGRALDDHVMPKYINTRDTLVYHKGSLFFGFDIARDEIKKTERAIVVEGEFDVISCFAHGIKNVVAIKGTALTESQAMLLSRFAKKVSLCLDEDVAGQNAVFKSIPILEKKGVVTTVIVTSSGKDPDEALKADPISFKKSVEHDIQAFDYLIDKAISSFDPKTAEGKKKITEQLLPLFSQIDNEVVKEHYLRKLGGILDTSAESVARQMVKFEKKEAPVDKNTPDVKEKKERDEVLSEYLLSLVLQAENMESVLEKIPNEIVFSLSSHQELWNFLISLKDTKFDKKTLGQKVPEELVSTFDRCLLFPLPPLPDEKAYLSEVEKVATEIRLLELKSKIKKVSEQIKEKEEKGLEEELEKLEQEFASLVTLLK
jgi:DNA primase